MTYLMKLKNSIFSDRIFLKNIFYLLLLVFTLFFSSCLGGIKAKETHYFSIPNHKGDNKNYYRMKIRANTVLSKVEYHSGWYPKESIDQLFGEVSSTSNTDYMITQRKLKKLNNKYIYQAEENYLKEAAKINPENLDAYFEARKRIQAYPSFESLIHPFGPESISYEYNPALGRVILHIDEKYVLFLSSNPDEIITEISSFTEANETAIKLKEISEAIVANGKKDLAQEKFFSDFNLKYNSLLASQIEGVKTSITGDNISKAQVVDAISILRATLKNKQ